MDTAATTVGWSSYIDPSSVDIFVAFKVLKAPLFLFSVLLLQNETRPLIPEQNGKIAVLQCVILLYYSCIAHTILYMIASALTVFWWQAGSRPSPWPVATFQSHGASLLHLLS